MIWLLVAIAGGVGAVLRFLTDQWISRRTGRDFPWGTISINVVGSLLAGFILGLSHWGSSRGSLVAVLITGLMGGYTTASTLASEIAGLGQARRYRHMLTVTMGTATAALAAASLGLWIGLVL
jgi:fluoride exporter